MYIEILHGGQREKHDNERNAEVEDAVIRPLECDAVYFNRKTKDIRLRMSKRKKRIEKEIYVPAIATIFSNNLRQWAIMDKFNLEKFRQKKEKLVELLKSATLYLQRHESLGTKWARIRVLLTEVSYYERRMLPNGEFVMLRRTLSEPTHGLVSVLEDGEQLMADAHSIVSVKLDIKHKLYSRQGGKDKTLTLQLKADTKSENDLSVMDAWLEEQGISNIPAEFRVKKTM